MRCGFVKVKPRRTPPSRGSPVALPAACARRSCLSLSSPSFARGRHFAFARPMCKKRSIISRGYFTFVYLITSEIEDVLICLLAVQFSFVFPLHYPFSSWVVFFLSIDVNLYMAFILILYLLYMPELSALSLILVF